MRVPPAQSGAAAAARARASSGSRSGQLPGQPGQPGGEDEGLGPGSGHRALQQRQEDPRVRFHRSGDVAQQHQLAALLASPGVEQPGGVGARAPRRADRARGRPAGRCCAADCAGAAAQARAAWRAAVRPPAAVSPVTSSRCSSAKDISCSRSSAEAMARTASRSGACRSAALSRPGGSDAPAPSACGAGVRPGARCRPPGRPGRAACSAPTPAVARGVAALLPVRGGSACAAEDGGEHGVEHRQLLRARRRAPPGRPSRAARRRSAGSGGAPRPAGRPVRGRRQPGPAQGRDERRRTRRRPPPAGAQRVRVVPASSAHRRARHEPGGPAGADQLEVIAVLDDRAPGPVGRPGVDAVDAQHGQGRDPVDGLGDARAAWQGPGCAAW